MPATPSNVINTDLTVGGTLSAPTLSVTSQLNVTGDEIITGNLTTTGYIVSNNIFALLTATGGSLSLDYSETLVTLSTSSVTTSFTITLPAGALVVAASLRVTSPIILTTNNTLTLNVDPTTGPTAVMSLSAPFTAGATEAGVAPTGFSISDADAAELVLSGALVPPDPPSGGIVRVTLYYWRAAAPSS